MTCPSIFRVLAFLAALLLSLGSAIAQTQPANSPTPAPVSVDDLQKLVNTLQDDKARAQLVTELQGLIAAQRGAEQKQAAENPATLLTDLSQQLDSISSEILDATAVVVDAPRLIGWLDEQASDAHARARWLGIGLKLGIVFGAAMLGEWIVRRLFRRPGAHLASRTSDALAVRFLIMLLQFVVEALPVLAFVGVAYFVLPLVQARFTSGHVAEVIIDATLTARLILAAARVLLLSSSAATLYPLGDETRNYLYIWVRRFTGWAVYGFALAAATWWLGIPGAFYVLLLRGTLIVLAVLAVIFVLQNRVAVADILRGKPHATGDGAAADRGWHRLRQRLADTWHVLAIIYIVATFGTYVLDIQGGFVFVFRATLLSIVVVVAAGLIVRSVRRLSQRGFAISADLKTRFPTLEMRANRYLPVLTLAVAVIVYFFAALTLLQAWGIAAFAWFDTNFGRRVTGGLVSIVLVTIVGFIVLSELGVDIAPLLAGAGVVGLAIGFGSQALVKDVITGLFILLEDTMAVGEVVDVGGGHTGMVEAISIRTIKLRDQSGTVHTVPFSSVSTVDR